MAQNLRPIVTIIGGHRVLDLISKLLITNSYDQRMDSECADFSYTFDVRRDAKMFDKYIPTGILKLSWTVKCRKIIPACILLVFDWSGGGIDSPSLESPDWKHKESIIMKLVRKYKDQSKGRIVKIGTLCFLGNTNEEITLEEKTVLLRKSGEIDSKGILLVRHKLEEGEATTRFKKFLWDSSLSHYKDEIDRLKKLKSRAHKELSGTFMELQVRYNFKLGFFSELRQDKESALNFYKKCYKEIQDPSIDPSITLDEKRAVADLVIHRIQCILLSAPHLLVKLKEAIGTFKTHISMYKIPQAKIHPGFEIWKWLSEHFSRFGTLLESVPQEILEKDNYWTHPGFYFQVAGIYYIMRMRLSVEDADCMQSVNNWKSFIASAELRIKDPVYLGQPKALASHPLQKDMIEGISTEDQVFIIKILDEAEIKHLPISLEYLFRSLKFYKAAVPMNKMCVLISHMLANLYKKKGDLDANYIYKSEIMNKMEGWTTVQTGLLEDLITFSEGSQKVQDLLQWTLKAMEIQNINTNSMFEKLNNTLAGNSTQIKSRGLIKAKAKFDTKTIAAYSSVSLNIFLTSSFPHPLSPVKVSLFFSENSFNSENFAIVTLDPKSPTKIVHTLVIRSPSLQQLSLLKIIARYEPADMSWIDFELETKAKLQITAPAPQLSPTFNHLPPALIGENYMLNIHLHPYSDLSMVKMTIYEDDKEPGTRRRAASIERNFDSNYCIFNNDEKVLEDGIMIATLQTPQTLPLRIIFYEEKNYSLKAKFSYTVHKPPDIVYKWEDTYELDISVQPPFQFKMKWLNTIEPLMPSVLNVRIWNECSAAIYLSKIALVPESEWVCDSVKCYDNLEVSEGSLISEDFVARVMDIENSCNLSGHLLVTWSRKEGVINDCRIPLTVFSSCILPMDLEVVVENEVFVGKVFEMTVLVKNKTKKDLEARIVMEETTSFLIGGAENAKFEMTNAGEKVFKFTLVGVEAGLRELPKVNINFAEISKSWQGKIMVLP